MRPSVVRLIALSGRGDPAIQLDSFTDIHSKDARELLGAIPAILAAPAAVAVEGTETSFDAPFYEWLVGRPEILIVALGNSYDVVSATTRTGIWDRIAPSIRLAGVIDRDYRDNTVLSSEKGENCIVLDFHEAESYLCHPILFCSVAKSLGTADPIPTEEEITQLIFDYFQQEVLRIAATRMASRARIKLNVSLQPSTFKYADEALLRQIIETEATKEALKANAYVGGAAVSGIFDEELRRCQNALGERDISKVLQFVPGKELLAQLAPHAGCKDASMLSRAVYKHLNPIDFEPLKTLRDRIATVLNRP